MIRLLPLVLLLGACATASTSKPVSPPAAATRVAAPRAPEINRDPFPSTYRPFASPPVLLRGAQVYDGRGGVLPRADVLLQDGRIARIADSIQDAPANAQSVDGTGKVVTPGIIDIHSHMGVYAAPAVRAHDDGNEAIAPNTAEVWAEHSVWPQDPQFSRALAAGVTTAMILPGSANLFGGRSVTLKLVPSRTTQGMKFPGAPYSLKMACGENPKRVYGRSNRPPATRMGNVALYRSAWIQAADYRRRWDDFLARQAAGTATAKDAPLRDLKLETLSEVLRGRILVQNHCYRADEMAVMIDIAREFGFRITTFHHAVESYKIADILARERICSAMWADWWGFKMESYDAIRENIPFVHAAGACAIVHSDDPYGIQRLNQEAAKALADGNRAGLNISKAVAMSWLTRNPAMAMGIADRTGTLEPGKMADVVLWSGDPFSAASRPEKVYIDGALMYDSADPARRPVSDFELGQPGSGDVK
jgi:imidazolonepropionase-like amidohydrolase